MTAVLSGVNICPVCPIFYLTRKFDVYCFLWFADIDPERNWRSTLGLLSFWHLKWWIMTLCHSPQTCGASVSSLTCCRFKSRDKWNQIHNRAYSALKLTFTLKIYIRYFQQVFFTKLFSSHTHWRKSEYINTDWECHCIWETEFYNGRKSLFGTEYLTELNSIFLGRFLTYNVREIKKEMLMPKELKTRHQSLRHECIHKSSNERLWEMDKRPWKHNINSRPITIQQQKPSEMGHGLGYSHEYAKNAVFMTSGPGLPRQEMVY